MIDFFFKEIKLFEVTGYFLNQDLSTFSSNKLYTLINHEKLPMFIQLL